MNLSHLIRLAVGVCIGAFALVLAAAGATPGTTAPVATAAADGPVPLLPVFRHVASLQAEVDFRRQDGTGRADTKQVNSNYVDHAPGWILAGTEIDGGPGIALAADSVYKLSFRVQAGSEPVSLPSSPVYTLQVRDPATGDVLAERLLHASDFPSKDTYVSRALWVSTLGGHPPRLDVHVYWHGQVNAMVDRVDIEQYVPRAGDDLQSRMLGYEEEIQTRFLDDGLLVGRHPTPKAGSDAAERGDSATFTSLYLVAEAMRLSARPGDTAALTALERGFRATERLFAVTGLPGVMARYADRLGNWSYKDCTGRFHAGVPTGACPTSAATCPAGSTEDPQCPNAQPVWSRISDRLTSEDSLVGYALGVAHGYPLIADPSLKAQVRTRMSEIAHQLLNSGFAIPAPDRTVWFTPYVSGGELDDLLAAAYEEIHDENEDFSLVALLPSVESQVRELKKVVNIYNSLRGILNVFGCHLPHLTAPNLIPRHTAEIAAAFDRRDFDPIVSLAPEYLDSARQQIVASVAFAKDVVRAATNAVECIGRLPNSDKGQRYRTVLRYARDTLIPEAEGYLRRLPSRITRLEDLPIKASRAAEALAILHAARLVDPAFDTAYYAALDEQLPILERWLGIEEKAAILAGGDAKADSQRSATNWRSLSALVTLAHAEPVDAYRERLRQLADEDLSATWDEHNPLYDAYALLLNADGTGTDPDIGVMAAQLDSLPAHRRSLYPDEGAAILDAAQAISGGASETGEKSATMRDPLPLSLVARGQMFWPQRNPRALEWKARDEAFDAPELGGVLAFWTAAAAGVELDIPQAQANAVYVGPTLIATTGRRSLTLGRGYDSKCKTTAAALFTDFPMPAIGYHPVQNVTGLDLAWVHARLFEKRGGQTSFSVKGNEHKVHWRADVCRRGGFQPGGELVWQVDIAAPTRTEDEIAFQCPREVLASSGQRGVTQGRTYRRKTKDIKVWVPLPAGWPALTPLNTGIGSGGFEDKETKISILAWEHVDWAKMQRLPNGVYVRAQVSGSTGGGGEIKFVAELKGRRSRVTTLTLPRQVWLVGQPGAVPQPKSIPVTAEAQGCALAPGRWKARVVSGADWGLNLRQTSGAIGEPLTLLTAATDFPLGDGMYSGQIEVSLDGAAPALVDVGMVTAQSERRPASLEAETGSGGTQLERPEASGGKSVHLRTPDEVLRVPVDLARGDLYEIRVRYSSSDVRQGIPLRVLIDVDGTRAGEFVAGMMCYKPLFKFARPWCAGSLPAMPLMAGYHELAVRIERDDGAGIEFDRFDLTPSN